MGGGRKRGGSWGEGDTGKGAEIFLDGRRDIEAWIYKKGFGNRSNGFIADGAGGSLMEGRSEGKITGNGRKESF